MKKTESELSKKNLESLGRLSLGAAMIACAMYVKAIVLVALWQWFIVGLGARELQTVTALGILLIIVHINRKKFSKKKKEESFRELTIQFIKGMAASGLIYLIGLMISTWMQ